MALFYQAKSVQEACPEPRQDWFHDCREEYQWDRVHHRRETRETSPAGWGSLGVELSGMVLYWFQNCHHGSRRKRCDGRHPKERDESNHWRRGHRFQHCCCRRRCRRCRRRRQGHWPYREPRRQRITSNMFARLVNDHLMPWRTTRVFGLSEDRTEPNRTFNQTLFLITNDTTNRLPSDPPILLQYYLLFVSYHE